MDKKVAEISPPVEGTPFEKLKSQLHTESKNKEDTDRILRENLGIGLSECQEALSESLAERASELLEGMINMAPYGDYGLLTEDKDVMLKFLQEESVKPENWEIQFVEVRNKKDQLMEVVFFNKSIDDGDILQGYVFIGLSGKIRHAFCQVQ